MRNHTNIFILFLFVSVLCNAQTWNQLEIEYNTLLKNKQNDLAVNKAKEIYNWVKKNEGDTCIHLPISLKYIGNAFINNDSAILYYDIALAGLKKQKQENHIQAAKIHFNESNRYRSINNKELCLREAESSIQVLTYLKFPEYPFCTWPLKIAAEVYQEKANYSVAIQHYKIITELIERYKGKYNNDYVNSLFALGNINWILTNYELSKIQYKNALEIQKTLLGSDNLEYSKSLSLIGSLYRDKNYYEEAITLYFEAQDIEKRISGEESQRYAYVLSGMAFIYWQMGNYDKAELYYNLVKEICKKNFITEDENYVSTLKNLGIIYREIGKFIDAELLFKEASAISIRLNGKKSIAYASSLVNLASLDLAISKYKESISLNEEALQIIKMNNGRKTTLYSGCINNLAIAYKNLGKYKNAERLYLESLEINKESIRYNSKNYYASLLNIGNYYDEIGSYKEAEKYYKEILNIKINYLERNFAWLSEKQKELFWKQESNLFHFMNGFAVQSKNEILNSSELSFNSSLFSKSILLQMSTGIRESIINLPDTSLKNIYFELQASRLLLSELNSEGSDKLELIESTEHQADSLDQLLSLKMSAYADYKKSFSLTWNDVQMSLSNYDAAIEFAEYYDDSDSTYSYMALIVKQGDKYPQLVKLCTENELKQYSSETELYSLYNLIWKPLLPSLTNLKTIYYSPSGLLNNIPFQALYKEENGKREYVLDKFTLHQLTSTRYLALGLKQKEQEQIESSIALFGGINYNDYPNVKTDTANHEQSTEAAYLYKNAIVLNRELDSTRTGARYLPGTKKEVEIIANVLNAKKWQVDVSEGKNATENKIKSYSGSNSKSILHIATHGFAFPDKEEKRKDLAFSMMSGNDMYKSSDNPMIRSGLLFGGANMTWQGKGDSLLKLTNEDGVLTAYELSQLDLSNTKLAVLSACETGKGEIQGSEGTFGLKRALKLAGVDNMIVSLWKVPDDATMEMMTLFYTELANTKKPVSSFETAQKIMRLNYPNEPEKWAGFVFVR
jgi:CHAT domain-containing protein